MLRQREKIYQACVVFCQQIPIFFNYKDVFPAFYFLKRCLTSFNNVIAYAIFLV